MTDIKPTIAATLAIALAAGHVVDPQTFKDAPPLASIPLTIGSTAGPTGPSYHPANIVRIDPVTDEVRGPLGPRRPVGPSAASRPPLLPTGPTGMSNS